MTSAGRAKRVPGPSTSPGIRAATMRQTAQKENAAPHGIQTGEVAGCKAAWNRLVAATRWILP